MKSNFSLPKPTRPPYAEYELSRMAERVIRQALNDQRRKWLKSEIDKSLDSHDKRRFIRLSSELIHKYH